MNKLSAAAKSEIIVQSCGIAALRELPRFRFPLSDFRFEFVRSQVSSFRFFFAALLSVFICENLWLKFPLTAFRFQVSGFRFQVLCFK